MKNKFNYLYDKKILVIVPHEDDELNLLGGVLNSNYINKNNVFVSFFTNGDYFCNAKIRIKEAIRSLNNAGIKKENIIFLGYCDHHFKEDNHIYMTSDNDVFISKRGFSETYLESKNFNGKHSKFNKKSLINDLIQLIKKYKPDIIFTNDFDSHPDHRCLSLCIDFAVGSIIKNEKNYYPIIYKGFCYPTEYLGVKDYDNINMLETKFNKEINNEFSFQNPYYLWENRVRFPVGDKTLNYLIYNNKLYKCIKKHVSQLLIRRYKSIINSDQVFFQRNTNNISLKADIEVSSGDSSHLNDFITFDCENIMHKDTSFPVYKDVSWIPNKNDKEKKIMFSFDKEYEIGYLNIYQNSKSKGNISKILLKLSNGFEKKVELGNSMISKININTKEKISWIKIFVLNQESEDSGFSEIEIFDNQQTQHELFKILIDDNFAYNKYYLNNDKHLINAYYYDGYESFYISSENLNFYVNGKQIDYVDLIKSLKGKSKLKITLKSNEEIYDEVQIITINKFNNLIFKIQKILNKIFFEIDYFYARAKNKLIKIFKKY